MSSVCRGDALDIPRPSSQLYKPKNACVAKFLFDLVEEISTNKLARFNAVVAPHSDVKKISRSLFTPKLTRTVEKRTFCLKDDMSFIVGGGVICRCKL